MLGLSGVPAVIMLLGLIFMPESPRWLVGKGNVERAKKVLKRIRKSDDVEDEISDILKTIQKERLGKCYVRLMTMYNAHIFTCSGIEVLL